MHDLWEFFKTASAVWVLFCIAAAILFSLRALRSSEPEPVERQEPQIITTEHNNVVRMPIRPRPRAVEPGNGAA